MVEKLKVVGLISGGKDSLFSLLHCLTNGHEIVALANLYPQPTSLPEAEADDLDSYMYQTVGHNVIPLYSEALGLPLYRQEITGTAVNADRDYEPTPDIEDETEALVPLLRRVMAAHPAINAVSTGAILSHYQRTRVESVAVRLGLVPLSYLWQYPYLPSCTDLLEDMATVGQDSRIIKVASGGLNETFLWDNVADYQTRSRLLRAMGRFGSTETGAVLGEGGEYETLALDGPDPLWKKKIMVEDDDMEAIPGGGGTAYLKIRRAVVCVKRARETNTSNAALPIPHLLDNEFDSLLEKIGQATGLSESQSIGRGPLAPSSWLGAIRLTHSRSGRAWMISNLTAAEVGNSAGSQMEAIAKKLDSCLRAVALGYTRTSDDIVFTTILLRYMSDFTAVNEAYRNIFSRLNPPARVTVACGDALPEHVTVMVSVIIDLGPRSRRQGLHVQSRSYWAPANIGPYSQAVSVPLAGEVELGSSLVYVAGQIPLAPASMDLIDQGKLRYTDDGSAFLNQGILSLQHLWRIGQATGIKWWTGAVAFVTGGEDVQRKALIAWQIWEARHNFKPSDVNEDEEEGFENDAWDQKYGSMKSRVIAEEPRDCRRLPDYDFIRTDEHLANAVPSPSFFAVQVDELPKGAQIEWQSIGIANGHVSIREHVRPSKTIESCVIDNSGLEFLHISISYINSYDEMERILVEVVDGEVKRASDDGFSLHITIYITNTAFCENIQAQIVTCRSIWGREGRRLAAAVVVRRDSKAQ